MIKIRIGIVLAVVLSVVPGAAMAKHIHLEKEYQKAFCDAHHGTMEVVLDDDTRVDCLTAEFAAETDFSGKWAESIGQSLHYSSGTGKPAAIQFVIEESFVLKNNDGYKKLQHLEDTLVREHLNIRVFVSTPCNMSGSELVL